MFAVMSNVGMIANFALATFMVGLTVTIHFGGLLALLWILRERGHRFRPHEGAAGQGAVILFVVLGLVAIHTIEIWLYAVAYLLVGGLPDFETALYFSTTSFTTLGYGDVVLDHHWRLFGAIEGANGLLLFGWSTAFLFSVTARLRALEHSWLERNEER
ncbi:Ion channel [Enhydrobacter aerosaccus]|uniref:Ion channel n=1 Tax=Enhydrobacter aerosaccus TaxID=225324 RepID=A0A1T4R7K3_9HYPH|nr:potassium channel family protein [Enhydrobacter aerosaccus]SKA12060.1 Ion channel [Enhydrobacter aerosaccus]